MMALPRATGRLNQQDHNSSGNDSSPNLNTPGHLAQPTWPTRSYAGRAPACCRRACAAGNAAPTRGTQAGSWAPGSDSLARPPRPGGRRRPLFDASDQAVTRTPSHESRPSQGTSIMSHSSLTRDSVRAGDRDGLPLALRLRTACASAAARHCQPNPGAPLASRSRSDRLRVRPPGRLTRAKGGPTAGTVCSPE